MYREKPPEIFQEIMEVLDVLPSVKLIQLKIYIKKIKPELTDEYINEMIEKMKIKRLIFEPVKGYISSTPKMPNKFASTETFFWAYLALMGKEKIPFSKAKYPADYIIVKDDKLVEIIVYEDNGKIKLNFMKHRNNKPNETIVLILVTNDSENTVPEEMKPYEQHQIISIYKNKEEPNTLPKFKISKMYEMREPAYNIN